MSIMQAPCSVALARRQFANNPRGQRGGGSKSETSPASLRRPGVAEPEELILAIMQALEVDGQYVERHIEAWDTERIAEVRSAGRKAGRRMNYRIRTFVTEPSDEGRVVVVVYLNEWPDKETKERLMERGRLLMDEAWKKIIPPGYGSR
jgi:hypothetical protein